MLSLSWPDADPHLWKPESDHHSWKDGYFDPKSLAHYTRLTSLFEEQFEDRTLAQAAFLHGIPSAVMRKGLLGSIDDKIIEILEGRERLASLDPRDQDVNLGDVLETLRETRSIILFLLERLDHITPHGTLSHWTRRFRANPEPFASQLPSKPLPYRHARGHEDAYCQVVFARIAEYFWLWHERNVFENAALCYGDPDRFHGLVDFAIACSRESGICAGLVDVVGRAVADLPPVDIRWEWRHVASMAQRIPKNVQPGSREGYLHRCGFVTVVYDDEQACYPALGLLHARFNYRPTQLVDHMWEPTPGGYRAIHTLLALPSKSTEDSRDTLIPVRLIPHSGDEERFLPFTKPRYQQLVSNTLPADKNKSPLLISDRQRWATVGRPLRVFTPEGKRVDLEAGATVLNFAYAVCNR